MLTVVFATTLPLLPGTALAAAGDLDTGFGTGGWALFGGSDPSSASSVVAQPDGKTVAVGSLADAFAVWRFSSDGVSDTAFATDGIATPAVGGDTSGANEVLLQPDGRIVAVGFAGRRSAVVRLTADGALDPSFGGGDGIAELSSGGIAGDAALLSDGAIVLGGSLSRGGSFLARLRPDGSVDGGFGVSGIVTDPRGFYALTTDERGIVAVLDPRSSKRFVVARYDFAGAPDETFGGNGARSYCVFQDSCVGYDLHGVSDVLEDAFGREVLALGGYFEQRHGVHGWGVMRLTSEGDRDETFSRDGLKTLMGTFLFDSPTAGLAIQDDGRIIVGGFVGAGGGSGETYPAIARLDPAGALDSTFGDGGMVVAPPENRVWSGGRDLTLQPDGKIVLLAGGSWEQFTGLARFLAA